MKNLVNLLITKSHQRDNPENQEKTGLQNTQKMILMRIHKNLILLFHLLQNRRNRDRRKCRSENLTGFPRNSMLMIKLLKTKRSQLIELQTAKLWKRLKAKDNLLFKIMILKFKIKNYQMQINYLKISLLIWMRIRLIQLWRIPKKI